MCGARAVARTNLKSAFPEVSVLAVAGLEAQTFRNKPASDILGEASLAKSGAVQPVQPVQRCTRRKVTMNLLSQMAGNTDDDSFGAADSLVQQGGLQQKCRLIVQQKMPPRRRDNFR